MPAISFKYGEDYRGSMEDNLRLCASAFVRNKGKSVFTESDILMGLSMDLRWMSYSEAKSVLSAMVTAGLFEKSGDMYRATFSNNDIDVPVAYKPTRDLIDRVQAAAAKPEPPKEAPKEHESVPEDMMPTLMKVAVENGIERREFMMQSNALMRKLGVFIEVAGLYVLRDSGVDVSELADKVYESVKLK